MEGRPFTPLLESDRRLPPGGGTGLKVLLIGHTCAPARGSEEGSTWNLAVRLAREHRVWVITHPRNREALEQRSPCANLTFVWNELPRWLDPWNPEAGESGVHLHYMLWQRQALRIASALNREVGFDIVHHAGWGTISAPPPFWRLGVPFVWGPVGGAQTTPSHLLSYFGSARLSEVVRTARVRYACCSTALKKAVRNSGLVLSTNSETTRALLAAGASNVLPMPDCGVADEHMLPTPPVRSTGGELNLLWGGRLEPRKCLSLALQAVAAVRPCPVRLRVAGCGFLEQHLRKQAKALGLGDRVEFLGKVPWPQMPALFRAADAFLFTSLRDSFGSIVLEAMAHALPVITLDHQGVGTFLGREAAIKVPVRAAPEVVQGLASAIAELRANPAKRIKMGEAAWNFARTQAWDRRAAVVSKWYGELVSTHALARMQRSASAHGR